MKSIIKSFLLILIAGALSLQAEDITTLKATNDEVAKNFDLEAVANVFTKAKDLEDFEKKLNDPELKLSNLDLNNDDKVDYLRVVDNSKGKKHTVLIQAVIGKDKYQDVVTIDVQKKEVKVTGDVELFEDEETVTCEDASSTSIVIWFWGPYYSPWYSPYYWGYYPPYYYPWPPYPVGKYYDNIKKHIDKDRFKRGNKKNSLVPTGRVVDKDWKTAAQKKGAVSKVRDNQVSIPPKVPPKLKQKSMQIRQPSMHMDRGMPNMAPRNMQRPNIRR